MALDPNISLQVKPIDFGDPMESMGRAMSLKNLAMQQRGMQQQQDAFALKSQR